ncbi:hypothetical protein ASE92_04820 [Pedobacter sp. Leaf41]|jgi:hypothetical protein|uniref:hypothetical protein n=1 Tax=Pedobacter sp. Leaf41 TaxID=1736218 RepID=UPI00070387F0|nr:hypothetical protein [Pedobacter sp. Leaf41]KQN38747.1 hypothetical protein ASE92_04820 [Pedobacter sp. Leaf41]RZL26438.1 MAG: hypothetical protein EOO96_22630 [Pedobacter sp.]
MRKLLLLLSIALLLYACQTDKPKNNDSIEFKNVNQSVAQSFSDLNKLDTFKIELTGRKPEEMVLTFTIKNFDGKEIYNVKLKGTDLLGNTDPNLDLSKEKAQIVFLKTIADDFFAEDNFIEPAVMPEDKPDSYVPDKALYEELKKSGLNGFKYRLGKEKNLYIAWSEKEKKVKIYYNCC